MSNKYLILILLLAAILRLNSFWALVLGVAAVWGIWFLTAQLMPKQKWVKEISALFLAISPWHISLIDYSLKASLVVLIVTLGVSFLFKALKGKWLYLSVAVLILAGGQIISPLVINLDNAKDIVWLTDQQRREHGEDYNSFVSKAFHNKAINYSLSYIEHWGEHFSGDFLFISGKMYLFDILFLLVGFFNIFKNEQWNRWGVVLLWLALAPINSAFNFGPPDLLKAALMIVPLLIIGGYGAAILFERYKHI